MSTQSRRVLLTLALSLCAVSLLAAPPPVKVQTGLLLQIVRGPEAPVFSVPISGSDQRVAVIPISGGSATAIKVVPKLGATGIKVDVYALYGEPAAVKNRNWCSSDAFTAELLDSRELTVVKSSATIEPPVALGTGTIELRLVSSSLSTVEGTVKVDAASAGCCGCNGLSCCPNPGYCLDCSVCGSCCNSSGQQ